MKRWVVVLLMVNIGLFAWQYDRHVEALTRAALERPALPANVPRLVLLRELPSLPALRAPSSSPLPDAPAPEVMDGVEASNLCLEAGPFSDEATRDAFRHWLRGLVATMRTRTETVRKRQLFWVYLEPASEEKARRSIADLRARGVSDYLLIRRGGLKNAISLGLFSSQDSVNRRLAELNEQGYQPIVVPRFETTDRYWITARLAARYDALPEAPRRLMEGAELRAVECTALATPESAEAVVGPATEQRGGESDRIRGAPDRAP